MDQITHEMRLADWQTIVTNCLTRPTGQSKKQWLAEHGVPEKSYYYWQRKIREKNTLFKSPLREYSLLEER